MQLNKTILLVALMGASIMAMAQTDKNSIDDKQNEQRKKVKKSEADFKDTEVNFLFNYYEQDAVQVS